MSLLPDISEFATLFIEDYHVHERDWTRPGFRAVAVHRLGNWHQRIRSRLVRAPFGLAYRLLYHYVRNHYGIELPASAKLGRRVVIEHQGNIVVHGSAEIGDECMIRHGVTLGNRHMDQPYAAPKLGKRVNVGAGAKTLGKVAIGDGANIGANAVVCQDVPSNATAVGVPAHVVQQS